MTTTPVTTAFRKQRRRLIAGIAACGFVGFLLGVVSMFGGIYALSLYVSAHYRKALARAAKDHPLASARDVHPSTVLVPVTDKQTLNSADLAFGEEQVRKMVLARPEMGAVKPGDPIWRYCAEGFAGRAIGERIYWNPIRPTLNYGADHRSAGSRESARIRIGYHGLSNDDTKVSDLWSRAAFELENIRGRKAFAAAWVEGLKGNVNRNEWLRAQSRPEHAAILRTRGVYERYWVPTAKARGISLAGESWGNYVPELYERWISQYTDRKSYPWDAYGPAYDRMMGPVYELKVELRRLKSSKVATAERG